MAFNAGGFSVRRESIYTEGTVHGIDDARNELCDGQRIADIAETVRAQSIGGTHEKHRKVIRVDISYVIADLAVLGLQQRSRRLDRHRLGENLCSPLGAPLWSRPRRASGKHCEDPSLRRSPRRVLESGARQNRRLESLPLMVKKLAGSFATPAELRQHRGNAKSLDSCVMPSRSITGTDLRLGGSVRA
jgi:hypothetical protein